MNINKRKEEKREREEFLFFLKVLAPLEYKNLKRAVSFEERAIGKGAGGTRWPHIYNGYKPSGVVEKKTHPPTLTP
jgi:hypothetical protein